jgi:type I restriction-modification system DNA methylase subunit
MGGRAAIIVPNGVLFGSSNAHQEIRKTLLENCQLQAVISMPSGVFKPYSGVGTAVLVFTKGGHTEKVWFYDMKADGYSLDDKRSFIDGKGDIPEIIEKFKKKVEGPNSILVPFNKIKENDYDLSYSRYMEVIQEKVSYENPKKIIDLSGAEFNNLILNGIDLRRCILIDVRFNECSMCGMLMDYNSREIKFTNCNLAGADMSGTLLRDSYFNHCNLSGANLSGANLRGAVFTESSTTSIDFTAANIAYTKGLTDKNIDDWYESTLKTIIRETSDDISDDQDNE